MINLLFSGTSKIIIPVLILSFLAACSASEHAGIAYKKKPPLTETDEDIWYEYWEDQFDARRGKVISPPRSYPLEAHSAYNRAAQNWNLKVQEARTQTYIAWIAGSAGVSLILYLIIIASTPSTTGY